MWERDWTEVNVLLKSASWSGRVVVYVGLSHYQLKQRLACLVQSCNETTQDVIGVFCQLKQTHWPITGQYSHPIYILVPAPVVNCIPLDDITGSKRKQDNKRPKLQATSFISAFITLWLMDVDLCLLLHLTCSISLPDPPHSPSQFSFFCYLWSRD